VWPASVNRSSWRLDPILAIALAAQILFGAAFIMSTRFDVHGQTYFTLFDDCDGLDDLRALISPKARDSSGMQGGPAVEGYTNFIWDAVDGGPPPRRRAGIERSRCS
jgi:hypothetical protein